MDRRWAMTLNKGGIVEKQTNNTHLLNIIIQLTKIADELKKANSLEHILTKDEKEFLCGCKDKKKVRKKK
jgi:uncharacterized UBP type Zn finger protein